MTTDSPPESLPPPPPDSSSSSSPPGSPLLVLGAVAVSLGMVAGVVVLRLKHGLDDVPGWGILAGIAIAGLGASERARILGTVVGTAARALVGRGRSRE